MSSNDKNEYLVEVNDLKQYFPIKTGFGKTIPLKAVDGVSFAIKPGETLGLVGESGCGKTTTGRTLLRLYEPTDGTILYDGKDITKLSKAEQKKFCQKVEWNRFYVLKEREERWQQMQHFWNASFI